MPKGKNQKFKLYRLAQIMLERTDDEHYITMPEIMEALGEYEVTAERKSIYNDLKSWIWQTMPKMSFGMFGGKEEKVKLLVHNSLAGVMIDRFGRDVMLIPADKDHFTLNVDVYVSRQFLGWVFSLGEMVKILGPEEVVREMREETSRLLRQYGTE